MWVHSVSIKTFRFRFRDSRSSLCGRAACIRCSGRGRLVSTLIRSLFVFHVVVLVLVVVSRVLHILISAMQSRSRTIIPMSMLHIQSRGPLCHSRSHCCNHCQCPLILDVSRSVYIRCQCLSMLHIQSRGPLCHSRSHCCNHCLWGICHTLFLSPSIR